MNETSDSSTTKVDLAISKAKSDESLMHIVIEIKDATGNPIEKFDAHKEKLMHLVIVSNNLQFFEHTHPTFTGKGRFEVNARLPFGGQYTLFSSYQPSDENEEISVLSETVDGEPPPNASVDTNLRRKTIKDTSVTLLLSNAERSSSENSLREDAGEKVKAGHKTDIQFVFRQPNSNEPITDLQPYLDAQGHLVVIKQSTASPPTLNLNSYMHIHSIAEDASSQVNFAATFPEPGNYKLWGEFNRGGHLIVADFWIEVL